jgi:hypothetical protein
MSKEKVSLPEDKSVETALAHIRGTAGDHFLVLGFSSGNQLAVIGAGEGGLGEAAAHCPDDAERYVYLRKDIKVELAKTTKFAFIDWASEAGLKPIRRAMLSQLRSQVVAILKPFNVELSATARTELTDDEVNSKLSAASGTKSSVTDKKAEVKQHKVETPQSFVPKPAAENKEHVVVTRAPGKSIGGGQSMSSKIPQQSVKFAEGEEEKFKAGQKNVHESKEELPWVVVAYSAKDTLTFVAEGAGVDSLVAALPEDATFPYYGLVRVDLTDGKSKTVRIVYLNYTNQNIPPLKKADASTKSGAISTHLGTSHANLAFSKPSELSVDAIKSAK